MSQPMEFAIHSGNPETDRQTLLAYQRQYAANGIQISVRPGPTGGFLISVPQSGQAPPAGSVGSAYGSAPSGAGMPAGYAAPPGYSQTLQTGSPGYPPQGAQSGGSGGSAAGYPNSPAGYSPNSPAGYPPNSPAGYSANSPAGYPPNSPAGYSANSPAGYPPNSPAGYGAPPGQPYGGSPYPSQSYGSQPAPRGPEPNSWNAPPFAAAAFAGGAVSASAPQSGAGAAGGSLVATLGARRVAYLRKVYGLLFLASLAAILSGYLCLTLGGTVSWRVDGATISVPAIVALMLENPALEWGAFGLLFGATFVASWVSKVRIVNAVAMFLVAALMGLDLAPMVFVAQTMAGFGATLSTAPVRDAAIMTMAVFSGVTIYIFVTRKDFSYLKATLSMGFWVVFGACLLAAFLHSEVFSLAVASVGAILSIGFFLYVTSYIFRNSEMDDPVGDALALLVQLRNLFMFLLRILMSARD